METQAEVTAWEKENMSKITGWTCDYELIPGGKIVTFNMSDKTKIEKKIKPFEKLEGFEEFYGNAIK